MSDHIGRKDVRWSSSSEAVAEDAVPDPGQAGAVRRDCAAVREFEQRFRQVVIEAGLPRMMAMVLISLHTTDSGSLTATELVEHLQVSPASISKAVQYLERMGFTRRERDSRRRHRRDIWDDVFRRQAQSMAEWGAIVQEGANDGDSSSKRDASPPPFGAESRF